MSKLSLCALAAAAIAFASSADAATSWASASNKLPCLMQMHGTGYAVAGGKTYIYSFGGNTIIDSVQSDRNLIYYSQLSSADNVSPGAWAQATATLNVPADLNAYIERAAISNGTNIFVIGGDTNGSAPGRQTFQTMTIGSTGDVTAVAEAALAGSYLNGYRYGDSAAFDKANNRVYALQCSAGTNAGGIGSVHVASVGASSIGTFASNSIKAAAGRVFAPAVVHNGYLYWIGGNGMNSTDVFTLGGDGMPTAVTRATATFPTNLTDLVALSFKGDLYAIGGCVAGNADVVASVYKATIGANGDITAWTLDGTLPQKARRVSGVATNDAMFVLGGRADANTLLDTVQIGVIQSAPPAGGVSAATDWNALQ